MNFQSRTDQTILPPLILHPFGGDSGTAQLLEGSRAAVALQQASISRSAILRYAPARHSGPLSGSPHAAVPWQGYIPLDRPVRMDQRMDPLGAISRTSRQCPVTLFGADCGFAASLGFARSWKTGA